MQTKRTIEGQGSEAILAMESKEGGEILVFGDDISGKEAIEMVSPWVDKVEKGETLKASRDGIFVHTKNPENRKK